MPIWAPRCRSVATWQARAKPIGSALEGSPKLPGALWNLAIAAEREGNAAEAEELWKD